MRLSKKFESINLAKFVSPIRKAIIVSNWTFLVKV